MAQEATTTANKAGRGLLPGPGDDGRYRLLVDAITDYAVFDAITNSLKKGDEVRLVGFGTFSVSKRKASIGRNPATGAEIKIPASMQAKFKPGKGLKDAIN